MSSSRRVLLTTTLAAALAVPFAGAAAAAPATRAPGATRQAASGYHVVRTLSSAFLAPLQFTVNHGAVYVADSGSSTLTRLGRSTPVAVGPRSGEIAGVTLNRAGDALAYTTTDYWTGATTLTARQPGGRTVRTSMSGYEAAHNPDGRVTYGVDEPSACVRKAFADLPDDVPARYQGIVESHPYSVASLGKLSWVVADAAGNDLVKVSRTGTPSLLTVLPRRPLKITAARAKALGLPACAVGVTYNFESVPTDVEIGPGGYLYVSTLPGGPEDPRLGAHGSVYKVNPVSGKTTRLATGFAGATNLAVTATGQVFVAELFAGRISTISQGRPKPVMDLPGVAGLERSAGVLYASTIGLADEHGKVVVPGRVLQLGR